LPKIGCPVVAIIPAHLANILVRIPINQARWIDTVQGYGGLFHQVVGRLETMMDRARLLGKRWLGGMRATQAAFSLCQSQ